MRPMEFRRWITWEPELGLTSAQELYTPSTKECNNMLLLTIFLKSLKKNLDLDLWGAGAGGEAF